MKGYFTAPSPDPRSENWLKSPLPVRLTHWNSISNLPCTMRACDKVISALQLLHMQYDTTAHSLRFLTANSLTPPSGLRLVADGRRSTALMFIMPLYRFECVP